MMYLEQLNRARRFLRRIEKFDRSQVDYEDDLWAFFQNCWHVKDWIKNDQKLSQDIRKAVEKDVAQRDGIMNCADLANRTKHLSLARGPRRNANHVGTDVTVIPGEETRLRYRISSDTVKNRDALEIAREALNEWEELLRQYGLPT